MKKFFLRTLAVVMALLMLASCMMLSAFAATYRNGAQSGPHSSYKNGRYYKNYQKVPITGDNRTDVIAIALSQLGYQEGNSNGSFSGEGSGSNNYVEFSYNMGDLGLGYGGSDYPWCACFVSWCLYQSRCTDQATYKDLCRSHSGDYNYIWKEISCSQWVNQLKGAGLHSYSNYKGGSYTPKYGDLVFFQNSTSPTHIGICLYTKDGYLYTVEGNTSDASGLEANGGGVYFKKYALTSSYLYGYGKLPYTSNSSVAKIDYSGSSPTPGLYVANASKYIYSSETATSYSYVIDRFSMFEITKVGSNNRLYGTFTERGGSTVTGWITNNTDRIIQLSSTENAKFTFQFMPNGGTGTMADQEVEYGVSTNISANKFTREGYDFAGWRAYRAATDEWRYTNGTDTGWYAKNKQPAGYYYYLYSDGQSVSKTGKGTGDIVKLYAAWSKQDYTVKYFANGGTGTMADSQHTYGVYSCLSKNTFTRSGHTFAGWYVLRVYNGKYLYDNGSDKTGYVPGTQPDGYHLALYEDQQNISSVCGEGTEIHCFAQWTPTTTGTTTYYIDYDANGGTGTMERQAIVYGTSTATRSNTFTREGHEFLGWRAYRRGDDKWIFVDSTGANKWLTLAEYEASTAGEYTYKTYKNGVSVSKTSSTDLDIITFYAQWKALSYTVKFVDYDGTVLSTQTLEYGKAATAPADPSREGYTFTGWDTAYDAIKGDTTITATYELINTDCTVTFVDYDGTVFSTQVVTKGGSATAPANPTRAADVNYVYTFAGWDADYTNVTTDITVTATYTQTPQVYYIRGSFNNWTTDNVMTSTGNGLYSATLTLEAGDYEFKAANADYSMEWPLGTNQSITLTSDSKVTFMLDTVNHRLTTSVEEIIIEYTVTFVDFDGTVLSTQKVVKGKNATAPAAPSRKGYNFTGWDKSYSNVTSDLTITAQYTEITPTGKLSVDVIGGTGFTLSLNDGTSRPQSWYYLNSALELGTKVNVTAQSTANKEFIGWIDQSNNKILATSLTYSFYSGGNDAVRALFKDDIEQVNLVMYKNDKSNQILDMQYYAYGDTITVPDDTMFPGYDFVEWSLNAKQIQSKLEAGEDVYVVPTWEVKQVYVAVDVTNGTVTGHGGMNAEGKYLASKQTTVEADAAASGMKFAYWTDANGKVKSYDSTYSFYPAVDTALTAVYVGENETINYQILVNMDACDTSGAYGTFYMSWYVPEGYTYMGSGLVAVNKDNYSDTTFYHGTTDANVWDRASSGTNASGTFTWTGPVMAGQTWYAKAWVQYSDANGNTVVQYSDMFEVTKL